MKGIILAGGSGTRLYPITKAISKQLVPVYDKPMIYYPLSVLMQAGIRDILIITTKEDQPSFKRLLEDGKKLGVNLSYVIQPSPDGLAQAFILGRDFIGDEACAMILGDNIFYGNDFEKLLSEAINNAEAGKATIFGYQVKDPERFGIMEIDESESGTYVVSVEEKPEQPKSDYAITGLYFYPSGVSDEADLVFDSLIDAANMIRSIEKNKDKIICCPEAIAYKNKWLSKEQLSESAEVMKKNKYGQFLHKLVEKRK